MEDHAKVGMKTLAIAGCIGHIGTTTQAIQATMALQKMGKSCYMEMNRTEYLERLVMLYSNAQDEKEKVIYSNIELYKRNFGKIISANKYDYVVKDFGSADLESFEESSFSGQKIKIVVCGSKPNEIFKTQEILRNPIYDDAYFIFSFVPEDERVSIASLMAERAEKTFFAEITTDPFLLTSDSVKMYNKILMMERQ